MRFIRFCRQDKLSYGILNEDLVQEISGTPFGPLDIGGRSYRISDVNLLAPVAPSKVLAVGLNYVDHAKELGMEIPANPILFMKPPTSVIGPDGEIVCPSMSCQVEYEAELVVVIKDRIKGIPVKEAASHILGYTCGNDVTARDLQKKDGQWTRAKSFDTFSPLGPWIETELDPLNAKIEMLLNGEAVQSSSTANMIFDVFELVSFISQIMTLMPGDVIMTGTPPGVGPVQPGDTTQVRIAGIGTLKNHITGVGAPSTL
jgi:2-keto-4-pentenoate hydratase/2-oxohepta-3-ene-1,7-dioic acid hydratase in catechol pathway